MLEPSVGDVEGVFVSVMIVSLIEPGSVLGAGERGSVEPIGITQQKGGAICPYASSSTETVV
jgi:hypothetical protein